MSTTSSPDDERDALKHSWDWFALHAGQRMQAVSHFLVAFALVLAGYGAAYQANNQLVAVGLALAGVLISVSFLLLELRTRQLVQAAEPALASLQARLAARSNTPDLEFVRSVENPTQRFRKYSFVIRALMGAAVIVMSLAAVVAMIDGVDGSTSDNEHTPWPPVHHRSDHGAH
jgi:hypothetical protein